MGHSLQPIEVLHCSASLSTPLQDVLETPCCPKTLPSPSPSSTNHFACAPDFYHTHLLLLPINAFLPVDHTTLFPPQQTNTVTALSLQKPKPTKTTVSLQSLNTSCPYSRLPNTLTTCFFLSSSKTIIFLLLPLSRIRLLSPIKILFFLPLCLLESNITHTDTRTLSFPISHIKTLKCIAALRLGDSRRKKLQEECPIKAKQQQRPKRSRIPPTPAHSHSPCTHPTTANFSAQKLAPVWGSVGLCVHPVLGF